MLAALGLVTLAALLAAIMSKRVSPLVALIVVPTVASLVGGFGLETGRFIVRGIRDVSPFAGMFIFAILYFGVMTDAGMLDPIIDRILRAVGARPRRIVVGTALLALVIHLDGSGAVTFLMTVPAMLPLYERLGMDRRVLACAASLAAGVNFLPWTGPTVRASAALGIPAAKLFWPLIPVQAVGLLYVFAVAYWLGRREEKRLALTNDRASRTARRAHPLRGGTRPAPPSPLLAQPGAHPLRGGRDDERGRRARRGLHARHGRRARAQLPARRPAEGADRRPRPARADHGGDPAGGGRVHRDHARVRHPRGDGAVRSPGTSRPGWPGTSRSPWGWPRCP